MLYIDYYISSANLLPIILINKNKLYWYFQLSPIRSSLLYFLHNKCKGNIYNTLVNKVFEKL